MGGLDWVSFLCAYAQDSHIHSDIAITLMCLDQIQIILQRTLVSVQKPAHIVKSLKLANTKRHCSQLCGLLIFKSLPQTFRNQGEAP